MNTTTTDTMWLWDTLTAEVRTMLAHLPGEARVIIPPLSLSGPTETDRIHVVNALVRAYSHTLKAGLPDPVRLMAVGAITGTINMFRRIRRGDEHSEALESARAYTRAVLGYYNVQPEEMDSIPA